MKIGESLPFGFEDTSYQAAGGAEGVKALVDTFYDLIDTVPTAKTLRALHPSDMSASRDKLFRFLCGWLGGPKMYQEKYGSINIPQAHKHLDIGYREQEMWLKCMDQAIDRQPYSIKFSTYLKEQFRVPAKRIMDVAAEKNKEV